MTRMWHEVRFKLKKKKKIFLQNSAMDLISSLIANKQTKKRLIFLLKKKKIKKFSWGKNLSSDAWCGFHFIFLFLQLFYSFQLHKKNLSADVRCEFCFIVNGKNITFFLLKKENSFSWHEVCILFQQLKKSFCWSQVWILFHLFFLKNYTMCWLFCGCLNCFLHQQIEQTAWICLPAQWAPDVCLLQGAFVVRRAAGGV